jgi:hypothetical protein
MKWFLAPLSFLRWYFGSRGEKDVEQDPIVGFDFEKFDADSVLVDPLDRSETHFHRRLVPGKIHHECKLLARPKQAIDTEPSPLT